MNTKSRATPGNQLVGYKIRCNSNKTQFPRNWFEFRMPTSMCSNSFLYVEHKKISLLYKNFREVRLMRFFSINIGHQVRSGRSKGLMTFFRLWNRDGFLVFFFYNQIFQT